MQRSTSVIIEVIEVDGISEVEKGDDDILLSSKMERIETSFGFELRISSFIDEIGDNFNMSVKRCIE